MRLRDFFDPAMIALDLGGTSKDEVLALMVGLLGHDERAHASILRLVQRREQMGSTGIGRGVAVPHCRTLMATRLRVVYGQHRAGVDFSAIDAKPVHSVFLLVAPATEVANQYLPVLGKIAQFAKESEVPEQLAALTSPDQFLELLDRKTA